MINMKKKIIKVFLMGLLQMMILQSFGQTFPVQVIPQVTPPPPVYLTDYANAGTTIDRIRASVILTDLTVTNRQVRLKLFIEGNGINAESRDFIVGVQPIFLDGGVPVQLGAVDLAPYFELQNLQGISAGAYANALPEGLYQFCFEVYDVLSGNRISSKSCTNVLIFLNEPPLLNLPFNNINLEATNPQNIVFQWTPRQINVSNVEYEFSLVEIWDYTMDPQAVFLASPPLYQTTTRATSLLYGVAEPQLLEGKRYAWRVQAKALDGIDEIGLFANNGYSEIFSFTYQGECAEPTNLTVEEVTTKTATFRWQGDIENINYRISYRKAQDEDGNTGSANSYIWFEYDTFREEFVVIDLEPNTLYEWRIGGYCNDGTLTYTQPVTFTTMAEEAVAYYNCGIEPSINISNQTLLPALQVGDVIKAGDFNVKVQEVTGSTSFTGKGYTTVGFLKNIKIALVLTNIQVNTDYQFVSGEIKTIYDPTWSNILDVDDVIDTIDTIAQEVIDLIDLIGQLSNIYNYIEDNRENLTDQEWEVIDNNVETIFNTAEQEIQTLINNGVLSQEEGNNLLNNLEQAYDNYEQGGSECEGQGANCNESLDTSQQTFETVISDVEAKKDIVFFEDAQKILSSLDAETEFWIIVDKLEKLYNFLKQCNNENWASYKNEGIIPYCFWRDSEVSSENYYTIQDIPFIVGLADGLYQEGEGIAQIPETLDKMSEGIRELTYAYTVAYLKCPESRVNANKERFENLLEKLEVEESKRGIWSWIKEKYYESKKDDLEEYINDCEEVFKLRKEIEELYEMVNTWEEIKQLYKEIKTQIVDYWNLLEKEENIGRYERGKLTIFAASFLVPGIGQLSKASKIKVILKGLKNFTKSQWDNLFDDILIYSDNVNRIFAGARQFVRDKYGQDYLNFLKTKFGSNEGAAAVIVQRFGDEGVSILNKSDLNNLTDAASELIVNKILYRHIDENASYLTTLKVNGELPSGYTTYITLDKFDNSLTASARMQLPPQNNAVWRLEFEGNQLINKVDFPKGKWNNAEYVEVLTRSYPQWGEGGATQLITNSKIRLKRMVNLKTNEVINFD